jgi:type II secretory pathway predicted ATPase ExeA/cell division septation protein DedD
VPQPVLDAIPQDPGSLTYEPYFGLREKPFSLSADPRFFFRNPSHGATFDALLEGIRRREGILVLTGEVGTGKTTVCRAVLQALDRKTFAAFVPDPFLSREDLLKTLLVDFGVVSMDDVRGGRLRGASRTDLSYPLYEFLTSLQPLQAFAVVMIDEAQNLPTELLEEIRILSDLENRQNLLEVLLVGQPELQSRLATSVMRQLSQRVTTRCELPPFVRSDVRPYVAHRLTIAGDDGRLQFTDGAIDLVCAASSGIPRVINLVCDRALSHAARCRTMKVDEEHIAWAVGDLKLPSARSLRAEWDRPEPPLESFPPERPALPTEGQPRQHQPQPQDKVWSPPDDPIVTVAGGSTSATAESASPLRDTLLGSALGETLDRSFPETPVPHVAFTETIAPASRGRTRLLALALVTAVLAPTTALVAYRYRMSPASPEPSSVFVQPVRPLVSPAASPAGPEPPVALPPVHDGSTVSPGLNQTDATAFKPDVSANIAPPAREHEPNGPRTPAPGQPGVTKFVLQMATFQSPVRAARALQELRDAGYHAYTIEVSLRDGGRAIAVLVGPYADLAPAQRDLARAQQIPGYGGGRIVQVSHAPLPAKPHS